MTEQPTSQPIDLEAFLASAGRSFTDAQKALLPGTAVSVNMMLSSAELELKAAVGTDAAGRMTIKPISSEDIARGGIDPGLVSTFRIGFVSSIGELPEETTSVEPGTGNVHIEKVPDVTGMTIREAADYLKAAGWPYEIRAAGAADMVSGGSENRGKVVKQEPAAATRAEKTTMVRFWVDLGSIPVQEIDGIGDKIGENLLKAGIRTVGDLSLADVEEISRLLRVSDTRARNFVDMAGLMSRLTVLGLQDEVVELLVKGAGIRSAEQLAEANAAELFTVCRDAIATGKVKTPRDFSFIVADVEAWIKAAGKV